MLEKDGGNQVTGEHEKQLDSCPSDAGPTPVIKQDEENGNSADSVEPGNMVGSRENVSLMAVLSTIGFQILGVHSIVFLKQGDERAQATGRYGILRSGLPPI